MLSSQSTPTDSLPPKSSLLALTSRSPPQKQSQNSSQSPATYASSSESLAQSPSPSVQPDSSENLLASSQEMFLSTDHATLAPHNTMQQIKHPSTTPVICQLTPEQTNHVNASRQKAFRLGSMRITKKWRVWASYESSLNNASLIYPHRSSEKPAEIVFYWWEMW